MKRFIFGFLLSLLASPALGQWQVGANCVPVGRGGTTVGFLSGCTNAGRLSQLDMPGSGAGLVSIKVQAAAGTYNFNLPTSAGTNGQVLTSGGGGANAMTWTSLAGGGTVTSVDLSMPSIFAVSSNPVTTSGTLTVTANVAQGDLIYASALNTFAALAKNATATRYLSNTGTTNNPAWAQVNLTNGVTGFLPIGNILSTAGSPTTQFLRGDGSWSVPAGSSGADPTGNVGLSAVNGVSTSFMRADGAPALSQSIAPTWTGQHIWQVSNAAAVAIGPNGNTNPLLRLVTNTASGNNGISLTNSNGSDVTLAVISGSTNDGLVVTTKGTGSLTLTTGSAGGSINANRQMRNATTIGYAGIDNLTGMDLVTPLTINFYTNAVSRMTISSGGILATVSYVGLGGTNTLAYSFVGDTNTGFNNPAADTIGFVAGGTITLQLTPSLFESGTNTQLDFSTGIGTPPITTSWLAIAAGNTGAAQIHFNASAARTSPANGDFWYETGGFKGQVGGSTVSFGSGGSGDGSGVMTMSRVIATLLAGSGVDTYVGFSGANNSSTTEANVYMQAPFNFTASQLRCTTYGSNGTGGTLVATLRVNGVDTGVSFSIAAGAAAGDYGDTSNSASVLAGEHLSVKWRNNTTAVGNPTLACWLKVG